MYFSEESVNKALAAIKEGAIIVMDTPYIVTKGRKGGSNVAAAICNVLIYMMPED